MTTGAPVTIPNVPTTSVCSFTETQTAQGGDFADASFAWDGYTFAPATVTVGNNTTVSSVVTNFFLQRRASLVLAKVLDGAGYIGTGTPFAVRWSCGTESGTVNLAPAGSQTVNVPANTSCTVVELMPAESLLDQAHDWTAPTYEGLTNGTVAVAPNGSARVTVTNHTTPVWGRLAVTKSITPANLSGGVSAGARFSITVSCNAPAQGENGNYTNTFSVAVGVPQQTPNLPLGTDCTVTEAAPTQGQLIDDSYAWGSTPASQRATVDQRDGVVTVTVTNTVRRVYGSLSLSKIVRPVGPVNGSGTTFSGTWSCQYGSADPVTGTWSRTGAGAATLTGPSDQILIGSSCSATETGTSPARPNPNDPSYVWGAETITGPVTITRDDPSGHIDVTNPVRRLSGSFAVGKSVRGGTAGTAFENDNFTFSWRCVDAAGAERTGTLLVLAGITANAPDDLPVASTCTVTETARPDPIDPYRWVTSDTSFTVNDGPPQLGTSVTFTLPETGVPVNVQATNVLELVQVDVTAVKRIEGATGGFTDSSVTFNLRLVCTLNGNQTGYGPLAARVGQSVNFENVPLGSRCDLDEGSIPAGHGLADASYTWLAPRFPDSPQTLSDPDGDYQFTVINSIGRLYGPLQLTKSLTAPAGVVASDRVYSGTWRCTHAPDDPVSGTWTVTGTGVATLTGLPEQGLPLTSSCTATETGGTDTPPSTDPSYSWNDPEIGDATVSAAQVATITVQNSVRRATHDVTIRKTLSGETLGYIGTGTPFQVDASCTAPGADPLTYTVNLAPGGQAQVFLNNVPEGWTCRVAELPPSADLLRNLSYAWDVPTISGVDADGSLTVTDDGALVVDNPILRVNGALEVRKVIATGVPEGIVNAGATFTGTYSCTYNDGAPDADSWAGSWSVTGATGGVATLAPALGALPVGTTCEITENDPASSDLVDASWRWADPVIDPEVTIEQGGPQTLAATNTPERVYSSMSVTKVLTGETGGRVPDAEVTMAWSCEYAMSTVASGVATLPGGGGTEQLFAADGSIAGPGGPILVPATSICRVVEGTLDQDQLLDTSYAWGAPVYSPEGGMVITTMQEVSNVTVTNTIVRAYGAIRVTKDIVAPEGVTVDTPQTFGGTYSCTYGEDDPVTGEWTVTDEGSVDIAGILLESECTITAENTPSSGPLSSDGSYTWGAWTATGPVTVSVDGPAELVVTNPVERSLTDLVVRKNVTGDTAGVSAQEEYDFTYTCTPLTGDPVTGAASIPDGGEWTSPQTIPVGSTCTVTEGVLPSVRPGYVWGTVGFEATGVTGTPAVSGQSVEFTLPVAIGGMVPQPEVTIENPLVRQPVSYTVTKSSDPASGSTVQPGQTITYTVTVAVTGAGAVNDVVITDSLAAVLDNATFVSSDAEQGTAELTGTTLTWNIGLLQADEDGLVNLTYTVRVNDDAWGATLTNVVTTTGEFPPGECPDCTTTTEHQVPPRWTLAKSADPASGSTVNPGDVITYTVTATNESVVALTGLQVSDNLADVLNHAAWGTVSTTIGNAELSGDTLSWTIDSFPAQSTATMTYTVRVDADASDVTIRNVVTGGGDSPPEPCPVCTTEHFVPPGPNPPNPPDPPLPQTGTNASLEGVLLGLLLSASGVGVLVAARRRRRS